MSTDCNKAARSRVHVLICWDGGLATVSDDRRVKLGDRGTRHVVAHWGAEGVTTPEGRWFGYCELVQGTT